MNTVTDYPKACRRSIRKITDLMCTSAETAYRMMLMTAALMDLRPEDGTVLDMILTDYGIEDGEMA